MTGVEAEAFTDEDGQVALRRLLEVTNASFEERAHLQRALDSRIVIEQAKGMLSERLHLTIDEAFNVLRSAARSNGLKLHDLARQALDEAETPTEIAGAWEAHLAKAGTA